MKKAYLKPKLLTVRLEEEQCICFKASGDGGNPDFGR